MEIFEPFIRRLREYIDRKRNDGRSVLEKQYPKVARDLTQGLLIRLGKHGGVILKEDTFVELGSPKTASSAFVLWTENLDLVNDELITLIGPDIREANGGYLPFGQIVLVGGTEIKPKHYRKLKEFQYVDNLEGYMVRAVPQRQRVWSRVSKAAVEKGFSIETLGGALISNFKSIPQVDKVEVVFVTSSEKDVRELGRIAEDVWNVWRRSEKAIPKRAVPEYNCATCENLEICEEIWKMLQLRKGISLEKRPAILCAQIESKQT